MPNAFRAVDDFERSIADYAGSQFAVAVDTCTSALFLSLMWHRAESVTVPARTYCSVPCAVIQAGARVKFNPEPWAGDYQLNPHPIIDSAGRFKRGMHKHGEFRCVSFHWTKILPLGRGGAILHDDPEADQWFRLARFSGRHACDQFADPGFAFCGWNVYMEPAYATRGLELLKNLPDSPPDIRSSESYPDLSRNPIYTTTDPAERYGLPKRNETTTWTAAGLRFRPITVEDAHLVMRWRNTEQARASFFDPTQVTGESHAQFLRNKPPTDHIWIVEHVDRALIPVGMVSLTDNGQAFEYGRLVIDAEFQGQGLAERIERATMEYGSKMKPLYGVYLPGNTAIAALHRKTGWRTLGVEQLNGREVIRIAYP